MASSVSRDSWTTDVYVSVSVEKNEARLEITQLVTGDDLGKNIGEIEHGTNETRASHSPNSFYFILFFFVTLCKFVYGLNYKYLWWFISYWNNFFDFFKKSKMSKYVKIIGRLSNMILNTNLGNLFIISFLNTRWKTVDSWPRFVTNCHSFTLV